MFKMLVVLATAGLVLSGCENSSETDNTNAVNPPASVDQTPMRNSDTAPMTDQTPAVDAGTTTAAAPAI